MRAAPPVSVRCSGALPWRMLRVGLQALAAGAGAAWALGHAGFAAAWALPVMALVALLAWSTGRTAAVELRWDGQRWTADGVPGSLSVMIDAGAALLLQLRPDDGLPPRWIAVTAGEAGAALHALRAAVYARTPPAAPGRDGLRRPR